MRFPSISISQLVLLLGLNLWVLLFSAPSDLDELMTPAVQILHVYSFTETIVVLLKMSNVEEIQ